MSYSIMFHVIKKTNNTTKNQKTNKTKNKKKQKTAKWKKVDTVTDGRVYILEFLNSSKKNFYWLQNLDTSKDEENSKKLNELIENPQQNDRMENMQRDMIRNLQEQTHNEARNSGGNIGLNQLKDIISGLGGMPQQGGNTQGQPQQPQQPQEKTIDIQNVLDGEGVTAALKKHESVPVIKQLLEHLPKGTNNSIDAICEHVRSPQFRSMASIFNSALKTGQLMGIMKEMGLDPSVGLQGVEAFLRALNDVNKEEEKEEKSEDSDKMDTVDD